MRLLAFESSAKAASVALMTDGVLTAEFYQNSGLTHSATLLAMADDLLRRAGLSIEQVDVCAVAQGPGSFTGIRIGIAAVKGLCWGSERPCIGISTLEAMAALHPLAEGILCPVMDARREQVYNALFRMQEGVLTRLTPDRAISTQELQEELQNMPGQKVLIGDGAKLCYNAFGRLVPQTVLAPEPVQLQRASGVAAAAWPRLQRGEGIPAAALSPCYLRLSQAERERLARMGQGT